MNENENEVVDSTNDTEETVNDEIVVDLDDEETEDKDKIIATLKAQKDHWKKKATEKPEVKEDTEKPEAKSPDLSLSDFYALNKQGVEEEDVSDVVKYAKLEGITVAEALKTNVVKAILDTKKEQRKVAQATNTGSAKRSSTQISDDELLANAKKGIMPESDADFSRLALLRIKQK